MEKENNSSLTFLNVLVPRSDNAFLDVHLARSDNACIMRFQDFTQIGNHLYQKVEKLIFHIPWYIILL